MERKRKIFAYTSEASEQLIEECLDEKKINYGIPNGHLMERWILQGIAREGRGEFKERAQKLLSERYGE